MPKVILIPHVFLSKSGPHIERLAQAGLEVVVPTNTELASGTLSLDVTLDELHGAAAIVAGGEPYTKRLIEGLPELRVISRYGVGFDMVDVAAATARDVAVAITAQSTHRAVAEHTMALIIATGRSLLTMDRKTRTGAWPQKATPSIRDKTLGIIGFGRCGRMVAHHALAMGMRVIAHDELPNEEFANKHHIEMLDLDSLLARADYVSLHCPLTESTRDMIDRNTLGKMKQGSFLINVSRGGVVVEEDLLLALRDGHLRGAGIDVFEQEPPPSNHPFFELDNVVLTPHLAGIDEVSRREMAMESAGNIVTLYQGDWPEGSVVNTELKESWRW